MNETRAITEPSSQPETTAQRSITTEALATDELLNEAFAWLCKRRKNWPPQADVWRLRRNWPAEKERLQQDLLAATYEIGVLDRVTVLKDGKPDAADLWSARDAVVMKALSRLFSQHLPLSEHCTHLKGYGGAKYAVRQVVEQLPKHQFVLKTDVQSYYATIDHQLVLDRLALYIGDRDVLNLVAQYLRRCASWGGLYWDHRQGIALGCPLSPIIGAFFLRELDEALEKTGFFYLRFQDDVLVLTPTRWTLRKAIKMVNQVLESLQLVKHPDKTYIGRTAKGFEFLGYSVSPDGLSVAQKTLEKFVARCRRLYEQGREEPESLSRLGDYVHRWLRWVGAGLSMRLSRAKLPVSPRGMRVHATLLGPIAPGSRGTGL